MGLRLHSSWPIPSPPSARTPLDRLQHLGLISERFGYSIIRAPSTKEKDMSVNLLSSLNRPAKAKKTSLYMNAKYILTTLATGYAALSTSCSHSTSTSHKTAIFPGTVIAAKKVTLEASKTGKGVASGSISGWASSAGFMGLTSSGKRDKQAGGALLLLSVLTRGYTEKAMSNTQGQHLTVQVDGTDQYYSVTQPVTKKVGYIPVGTHGLFYHGSNESHFEPDNRPASTSN